MIILSKMRIVASISFQYSLPLGMKKRLGYRTEEYSENQLVLTLT